MKLTIYILITMMGVSLGIAFIPTAEAAILISSLFAIVIFSSVTQWVQHRALVANWDRMRADCEMKKAPVQFEAVKLKENTDLLQEGDELCD